MKCKWYMYILYDWGRAIVFPIYKKGRQTWMQKLERNTAVNPDWGLCLCLRKKTQESGGVPSWGMAVWTWTWKKHIGLEVTTQNDYRGIMGMEWNNVDSISRSWRDLWCSPKKYDLVITGGSLVKMSHGGVVGAVRSLHYPTKSRTRSHQDKESRVIYGQDKENNVCNS